ncbi:FtsW/RodA/SpoVE family cell cycle protein [Chryseomicrobium palamuruense]|uniref:FtsW/RodA/SpoVE family cell cycle protein n=1 Tax=Chryseomicrobium palamuruense TaxID=682973 RepID=A0ABV8UV87_9BACL
MNTNKQFTDRFDWVLGFLLLLFLIISLMAISSAQTTGQYGINFIPRQLFWYIIGMIIIAMTMFLEPEQYKRMAWIIYGIGLVPLIVLAILPGSLEVVAERNGAQSWFHLPFGIGSIQPAEFMKTFYILAVARVIVKHHENYPLKTTKSDFLLLVKIGALFIVPFLLIMTQPDLGTGLVFIAITVALIVVAGITWKIILPILGAGAGLGGGLIWMALYMQDFFINTLGVSPYQRARIYSWLDPYSYASNEGLHLISSLNAIGSGEIFGKGYQGREVYVPENHTDFIFAVIGEEFGFVGASLVIVLYFVLIYHLTKLTLQLKDPFSTYVAAGIIAMITFHVFENIGMTIQLLPITGIPLPFISYGGSSLMGNMLALGLIFSMKFHHKTYMFGNNEDD